MKLQKAFFVWRSKNLAPVILNDGCECRGKVDSQKQLKELLSVLVRTMELSKSQRDYINDFVDGYNANGKGK